MNLARTMWGVIETQDHRLMRRVNRWRAPKWVRLWMTAATRGGDGWLWSAVGVVLLLTGGEARYAAFASAAFAVMTGIAAFILLKKTSGRKRPCAIEPHCWAALLPPDQFSFPSGHSITAFAVAIPLLSYYPAFTEPLLFCAFSIALSRIVLGMHFLSDVVAGVLLGSGLGYFFYRLLL